MRLATRRSNRPGAHDPSTCHQPGSQRSGPNQGSLRGAPHATALTRALRIASASCLLLTLIRRFLRGNFFVVFLDPFLFHENVMLFLGMLPWHSDGIDVLESTKPQFTRKLLKSTQLEPKWLLCGFVEEFKNVQPGALPAPCPPPKTP